MYINILSTLENCTYTLFIQDYYYSRRTRSLHPLHQWQKLSNRRVFGWESSPSGYTSILDPLFGSSPLLDLQSNSLSAKMQVRS